MSKHTITIECNCDEYLAALYKGDLIYTHKMGLPPETQWIAENAIKDIYKVIGDVTEEDLRK